MTVATPEPPRDADVAEWMAETAEAIEIEGYTQFGGKENEKTLDELIGVPFLIKSATFRHGDITPRGWAFARDYVSCEVLISPAHAHKFPRKYVVFNDGSTGIYRQIVAALVARDLVQVPQDLPEEGPAHETRYDVSFSRSEPNSEGETIWYPREFPVKLLCPEGLRKSDYDNPAGGGKSTTWYLA